MAAASKEPISLNFGILAAETQKAFDFLAGQEWLKNDSWYLAGGTALALQAGHRKSYDLDFFNKEASFESEELIKKFLGNKKWETTIRKENTIYGKLFGAKVSFIAYPFFVPDAKFIRFDAISILSALDIAVMKIIAISQRGRKRDFFDLYWCAKNIEPLEQTIRRLKKQYPTVAHDYHHILKSLAYFNDAEIDPDPEINFQASWKTVKQYFQAEIPKITKQIIGLDSKSQ